MSYHARNQALNGPSNDYHLLPVTDRQMRYARAIAEQTALEIPVEAQRDRKSMSAWISAHKPEDPSPFANYPTGKQSPLLNGYRAANVAPFRPSAFETSS